MTTSIFLLFIKQFYSDIATTVFYLQNSSVLTLPISIFLTDYISDGLKTGCSKCTARQRKGIKKVMKHLIKHEPEYWKQAVDKYDPDRLYTKMYEKEVESWS
ncbi:hypothetical protein B5X24_HaOG201610 [Helicoverpa armigera]|nr:hypothetical protein B5X24_HaOG201610 [Helicoverpa armigera]